MPLIYKYLPPDREKFFDNGLLRMTQPGDLNDPLECLSFHVDIDPVSYSMSELTKYVAELESQAGKQLNPLIREGLKQETLTRATHPSTKNQLSIGCYKSFIEYVNNRFGIVSFSGDWSSSTMWAHYADSHQGFCLGIEQEHYLLPTDSSEICYGKIYDVKYEPKRITQKMVDYVCVETRYLFIKATDWGYETEIRVLYELANAEACAIDKSNKAFLVCLKQFPHSSVKEVLVGYHANDELSSKVCAFAKTNNIPAYRMGISLSPAFTMERESLI